MLKPHSVALAVPSALNVLPQISPSSLARVSWPLLQSPQAGEVLLQLLV